MKWNTLKMQSKKAKKNFYILSGTANLKLIELIGIMIGSLSFKKVLENT